MVVLFEVIFKTRYKDRIRFHFGRRCRTSDPPDSSHMPYKSDGYRKLFRVPPVVWLMLAALTSPVLAGITTTPSLSLYDTPRYKPGFTHFDFVNPDAPKGGKIRLAGLGTFDTLNPYVLKGIPAMEKIAPYGITEMNEPLMVGTSWYLESGDEPQSAYCLICTHLEYPDDFSWVIFQLNPKARFHNGDPITAADVANSFQLLMSDDANPLYRNVYGRVKSAEVLSSHRVKFSFKEPSGRSLILRLGELPVMSKKFWDQHPFGNTPGIAPPLSGPYRVKSFKLGHYLTLERVKDFWAKDHPVYRGMFNFDEVTVDFYRDRTVAFEALKTGHLDFWIEYIAKNWSTGYDFPALHAGTVVRGEVPHAIPSGTQAFFINTRRDKFKDLRTRKAIALLFDFAWTNHNIFAEAYKRSETHYPNSIMGARGLPNAAELRLLEPYRDQLPRELFTKEFHYPVYDGSGNVRQGLREAMQLLQQAGWEFRDQKLVNSKTGEPFVLEIMNDTPSFQRVLLPFVKNLQKVGITVYVRIVDPVQLKVREDSFDFDLTITVLPQTSTPGQEQRLYFHSSQAIVNGSKNLSGVQNPVVDAMLDKLVAAQSMPELVAAARALDRVLLWNYYTIPQWYLDYHRIAYQSRLERPAQPANLSLAFQTWWIKAKK